MDKVCCVIPTRLSSERFPNKILEKFKGKTLLENSINIAKNLNFISEIIVASSENNEKIKNICENNNVIFYHIKEDVKCGTEKLVEIKNKFKDYDIYMTLPSDEPSINFQEINNIFSKIDINNIYTLYTEFYNEEDLIDNKSCKIVTKKDFVLYTSRAVIPSNKEGKIKDLNIYKKHIGIFFFPNNYIKKELWYPSDYIDHEGLEQNYFIPYLKVLKINHKGFGIDSKEQLKKLEERFNEI